MKTIEIPTPGQIFTVLQKEHKPWADYNFPGREPWMPLVGLGEELGELSNSATTEDVVDAIGDCCVYIADYCNFKGYNMQEIYNNKLYVCAHTELLHTYGKLCHAHLKEAQQIRMHENHRENAISALCGVMGYLTTFQVQSVELVAWAVWSKVKMRDWQKNKNTAHEDVK